MPFSPIAIAFWSPEKLSIGMATATVVEPISPNKPRYTRGLRRVFIGFYITKTEVFRVETLIRRE
jgi:hypothetical protein